MAYFASIFGGGSNRQGSNPIAIIAMMILAPLAATVIRMAISRTREFGADRGGAEICQNPLYLANALRKLGQTSSRIPFKVSEQAAEEALLI